jgi:hypothetical protein
MFHKIRERAPRRLVTIQGGVDREADYENRFVEGFDQSR